MQPAELAQDGSVVFDSIVSPARGLRRAAERRRAVAALLVATAASLAFASFAAPRLEPSPAALSPGEAGPDAQEPTPYQREEALATARKVAVVGLWARGALAPALHAAVAALFLWLGFRVAGAAPALRPTLAVVAHGMLPVWLGQLLAIPALVLRAPVTPEELGRLLPSSLAALLPPGVAPPQLALAGAFDLFALWAVALVSLGMARVSGASRVRSAAVTVALWLAYVVVLKVAPAAAVRGP
jgi:hypothetical protein